MECVSYTNEEATNVVCSSDACNGSILTQKGAGVNMNSNNQLGANGLKKKYGRGKKYYERKKDDNEESKKQGDLERNSSSTYRNELKPLDPSPFSSNNEVHNWGRKKGKIPFVKYSKTISTRSISINENKEKGKSFSIDEIHSKELDERRHLYAHEKKTIEFPTGNMDGHSNPEGKTDIMYINDPINYQMKTLDSLETCNKNSSELNSCFNENDRNDCAHIENKSSINYRAVNYNNTNESGNVVPSDDNCVSDNAYHDNSHKIVQRNIMKDCNETLDNRNDIDDECNVMENFNGVKSNENRYINNGDSDCYSEEYQVDKTQLNKSCTQPGFIDKAYSRRSTRNTFSNKRMNLKSKTCVANFVCKSGGSTDFKSTLNIQFSKTKMCPYMNTKEKCKRFLSNLCPYAHDESELKPIPNLYKTTMCRNFMNNLCFKSKKECNFAHHVDELRSTDEFYKTTLCKFFTSGYCKADNNCRHAHGYKELKLKPSIHLIENTELNKTEGIEEDALGITKYDIGTSDIYLEDSLIIKTMTDSLNFKRKDSAIHLNSVEKNNSKNSQESFNKQEEKVGSYEEEEEDEDEEEEEYGDNVQNSCHRNSMFKKKLRRVKKDTQLMSSNSYKEKNLKENIKVEEIHRKRSMRWSRKNSTLESKNRKEEQKRDQENYYEESAEKKINTQNAEEEDVKYINTRRKCSKQENTILPLHDFSECMDKEGNINEEKKDKISNVYEKENEFKTIKESHSIKSTKSMKNKKNVANSPQNAINTKQEVLTNKHNGSDSKKINENKMNMHLKKKIKIVIIIL